MPNLGTIAKAFLPRPALAEGPIPHAPYAVHDQAALVARERQLLQKRKWGVVLTPDEDLLLAATAMVRALSAETEHLRGQLS